jgi:hypothetical protein
MDSFVLVFICPTLFFIVFLSFLLSLFLTLFFSFLHSFFLSLFLSLSFFLSFLLTLLFPSSSFRCLSSGGCMHGIGCRIDPLSLALSLASWIIWYIASFPDIASEMQFYYSWCIAASKVRKATNLFLTTDAAIAVVQTGTACFSGAWP